MERNGFAIQFEDVHKAFDDNEVLNGLNLQVP